MADQATLDVLIKIRDEIAGLNRTRTGLQEAKKDAEDFGSVLRQGLGIGTGMQLVSGGIALLKSTLRETAGEALRFAGETKDAAEALGLTTGALQVLQLEFKAAGADASRLTEVIAGQTRGLAEARDASSAMAIAYRDLGLEAAEVEKLPIADRLLVVARAFSTSTDKAKALTAASQILGSRGLLQMLNALQHVSAEGIPALDALYASQGQIMDKDTIARLDAAGKQWEKFWHSIVIGSGEALAGIDMVVESSKKNFWGTLGSGLLVAAGATTGANLGQFADTVAGNVSPATASDGTDPEAARLLTAELKRQADLRTELLEATVDLAAVQSAAAIAEADTTKSAAQREQAKLDALSAEVETRTQIVDLLARISQFDTTKTPQQKTTELIQAETELSKAIATLNTARGHTADFSAQVIETNIAQLEEAMQRLQVVDPTRSTVEMNRALVPLLEQELQLYLRLAAVRFSDATDLQAKKALGTITADELQRLNDYVALQEKINALRGRKNEALGDTNTRPSGALAGVNAWLTDLGTLSEQTADIVHQSLGTALSSLSSDIWEAMKGTQQWGDAWKNLGDIAGRMLTQIITQMIVLQALNAVLGIFGFEITGGSGQTITKVTKAGGGRTLVMGSRATAAGGGTFVTHGPTQFTVGDNPGGVELVSVTPISGVGQSTINGQAVHMAGGGTAVVASGTAAAAGGDTFNFTYQFNGGVSREEVMGMLPQMIQASKAAVLDASRRRRDGFR